MSSYEDFHRQHAANVRATGGSSQPPTHRHGHYCCHSNDVQPPKGRARPSFFPPINNIFELAWFLLCCYGGGVLIILTLGALSVLFERAT